jgi:hypothetical protein
VTTQTRSLVCVFRSKSITDSTPSRTPIPVKSHAIGAKRRVPLVGEAEVGEALAEGGEFSLAPAALYSVCSVLSGIVRLFGTMRVNP